MLFAEVGGELPGHTFRERQSRELPVEVTAVSETPLDRIELVVNGEVTRTFTPGNLKTEEGAYESVASTKIRLEESAWIAVRAFEKRPGGRVRFAHSSPVFIDIEGKPLRPRTREVEYLMERVRAQIKRSADVLAPEAIAEYRRALAAYREIAEAAGP